MEKDFIASVYRENCGEIKIINKDGEDLTKTKSIHYADGLAGFYVERVQTKDGRSVNFLTNDEFSIFVKDEKSGEWVVQGDPNTTLEQVLEEIEKQ